MNAKTLMRYTPPAGPLLGLLLIGLVLASALLYYRAVKIERYLEPALALTRPRNEFSKKFNEIFVKEFGNKRIPWLWVSSSSIFMESSHLFSRDDMVKRSAREDLHKIAHIFMTLMQDGHARSNINLILILASYPSNWSQDDSLAERTLRQRMLGLIQDEMFLTEPELKTKYSTYFAIAVQAANQIDLTRDFVEFRIVPSEYVHIEVLEKLRKYTY